MPPSDRPPPFRLAVNAQFYLSEMRRHDKSALVEHLNNPDIYERTLRIPYPYDESDALRFLEIVERTTAAHGHAVHFAIRNEFGVLVGGCGFEGLTYGHRAEIGYWLAQPLWGRGVMTQVVGVACDYAIENWKLVRVTAHVFESNAASARVLQKNGFQWEGRLRKHHLKSNQFLDSKLYALVR